MFDGEELETEAQNRVQNLMWTVSGDYAMDGKPDMTYYRNARSIALYDAVKAGAFARYFDNRAMSLYLIKKVYCGAQEKALTDLAQLCVDAAGYPKVARQRPGVEELRKSAFEDLLELAFHRMSGSPAGRLKIARMKGCLTGDWSGDQVTRDALAELAALETTDDTMDVIRAADRLYNTMIDRTFEKKHGDLARVLAVTLEELQEFDWSDFLEEELDETAMEAYLGRMNRQLSVMAEEPDEKPKEEQQPKRKVTVITPEAAAKMHTYIELNYGRSYLSEREQKYRNQRLCRGAHADCSLYYTDGILADTVKVNAQYVNACRHAEKNKVAFRNNHHLILRSVEQLTDELRRTLLRRNEPEMRMAWSGDICPSRLWKVGRMDNPGQLFTRTDRCSNSDFVVDILMDASGSQRDRQSQVALQAYILSEALSNNHVPHRITSFCSFWDYTVLQRFREYDAPRADNRNILNYVTSSNNRDGLAIRAVGDDLLQREEEGKVLIVLSDGRPNDIIVNRPNSRNPRPYYGEYAVKDTAFEVRSLRTRGVCVLGVFTGKESELFAEKKIFGRDFAYIRSIDGFARAAGHYLRRLLETDS